jgi:hypothetical protein
VTAQTPAGLTLLGTPDAALCEGDACLIPGAVEQVEHTAHSGHTEQSEHAIVARRLDDDRI